MKSICFLFIGLLSLTPISNVQSKPLSSTLHPILSSIIASGLFVDFDPTPLKSDQPALSRAKLGGSTLSQFPGESFEHIDGVYGSLKTNFKTYKSTETFQSYSLSSVSSYRIISDEARLLSKQASLKAAMVVRERLWPGFSEGVFAEPILDATFYRGYEYSFDWISIDNTARFQREVSVTIRRLDGKCTSFRAIETPLETQIKAPTALQIANKTVGADARIQNPKLHDWSFFGTGVFIFQYDAIVDNFVSAVVVLVESETTPPKIGIEKNFITLRPLHDDYFLEQNWGNSNPVWTRRGLVFLSYEFRQVFGRENVPQGLYPRIMLREASSQQPAASSQQPAASSQCRTLFNGLNSSSDLTLLFSAPSSDWIVFGYYKTGSAYALNVANGTVKVVSNPHRPYWNIQEINSLTPQSSTAVTSSASERLLGSARKKEFYFHPDGQRVLNLKSHQKTPISERVLLRQNPTFKLRT